MNDYIVKNTQDEKEKLLQTLKESQFTELIEVKFAENTIKYEDRIDFDKAIYSLGEPADLVEVRERYIHWDGDILDRIQRESDQQKYKDHLKEWCLDCSSSYIYKEMVDWNRATPSLIVSAFSTYNNPKFIERKMPKEYTHTYELFCRVGCFHKTRLKGLWIDLPCPEQYRQLMMLKKDNTEFTKEELELIEHFKIPIKNTDLEILL